MHPVLLKVGGISVESYFVLLLAAFLVAAALAWRRTAGLSLSRRQIADLGLWVGVTGLAGARAGYLLLQWDYYALHPQEILRLDLGGFSFFGALAAWLGVLPWRLRRLRVPVLPVFDRMIAPWALASAVAKVGCFLQGCCYGRFTARPWGVIFPGEARPRHPVQLYEMAGFLFLFLLVLFLERRPVWRRPGRLFFSGIVLFGLLRLGAGFFRV